MNIVAKDRLRSWVTVVSVTPIFLYLTFQLGRRLLFEDERMERIGDSKDGSPTLKTTNKNN